MDPVEMIHSGWKVVSPHISIKSENKSLVDSFWPICDEFLIEIRRTLRTSNQCMFARDPNRLISSGSKYEWHSRTRQDSRFRFQITSLNHVYAINTWPIAVLATRSKSFRLFYWTTLRNLEVWLILLVK